MQSYTNNKMKYFNTSGLTLITSDVEITTPPRDGINIPSTVTNKSNVIVNKRQFFNLKEALNRVPITNYAIHLYDQFGNIVSRMEVNRKSNMGGMLGVNTEAQTLLSHIVIPNVDDGATNYLILQEYPSLNNVYSEENKVQLLKKDIEMLNAKAPNLKKVVLVIAESLHKIFLELYPTYVEFFQVVPVKDENVINYVAEHLCGKIIAGSKPSFQGFLNFGENTTILRCTSDNSSITYTIRSNGRIQINTDKESTSAKFLVIIENSSLKFPYKITEEVTSTSFTITDDMIIKSNTISDINPDYILSMIKMFKFGINLNSALEDDEIDNFVLDETNHKDVVNHLFTKPLQINKEFVKLSDNAKLIVRTYQDGFNLIKQSLSKIINETQLVTSNIYHQPLPTGGIGRQSSDATSNYYMVGSSSIADYGTPLKRN